MKLLQNSSKVAEIESRLTKYTYLSRFNLPGYPDGLLFQILTSSKQYPDRKLYPNLYHWYILMRQFAPSTIQKWISQKLYLDSEDGLISKLIEVQTASLLTTPSLRSDGDRLLISPKPCQKLLKGQTDAQVGYVIDILLKDYCDKIRDVLEGCLSGFRESVRGQNVELLVQGRGRQVKISYRGSSDKYQEMVALVSKSIEFQKMQVKKNKKIKTSTF